MDMHKFFDYILTSYYTEITSDNWNWYLKYNFIHIVKPQLSLGFKTLLLYAFLICLMDKECQP